MSRGFAAIALHQPKDPLNVGEVLRAAGCYGAAMVAASGVRYHRARTDTQAAHRHLQLLTCDDLKAMIPHGAVPVAVDLIEGAQPLPGYKHPRSAFYVFGPEDGTLGPEVLAWCRDVVYVPTRHCMNLAATVNVVLYDRAAKQAGYEKLTRSYAGVAPAQDSAAGFARAASTFNDVRATWQT